MRGADYNPVPKDWPLLFERFLQWYNLGVAEEEQATEGKYPVVAWSAFCAGWVASGRHGPREGEGQC